MTRITVHAYADLRQHLAGARSVELEIAPGTTVGAILQQLEIPAERARMLFLDHRAASLDTVLQGGERLDLFSAIGGG